MLKRLFVGILFVASGSAAQPSPEPRAFVCTFDDGAYDEYDGVWRTTPSTSFMDFTLAALDEQRGTAEFVGNLGAVPVAFIRGFSSRSFIEVTAAGVVNLITIFDTEFFTLEGTRFPAVYSRHVAYELGDFFPSHWRGVSVAGGRP